MFTEMFEILEGWWMFMIITFSGVILGIWKLIDIAIWLYHHIVINVV